MPIFHHIGHISRAPEARTPPQSPANVRPDDLARFFDLFFMQHGSSFAQTLDTNIALLEGTAGLEREGARDPDGRVLTNARTQLSGGE